MQAGLHACHLEQKNWAVVRHKVGYSRMEGEAFVHLLSRLYLRLRLHLNYFQPSLKLLSKKRDGARARKTYDTAQTPLRRLIAWHAEQDNKDTKENEKEGTIPVSLLEQSYLKLNPAQLRRQVEAAQTELQKALVEKSIEVRSAMTKAGDECIKQRYDTKSMT